MIKTCAHCGRPFKTNYEPKIYCSLVYRDRAHRKRKAYHRQLKEKARELGVARIEEEPA